MSSHPDCLICATQPSLNFCKLHILNYNYNKTHAKFTVSGVFQLLNFLSNAILVTYVIHDILRMYEGLQPEDLLTFIKVSTSICIIYCNSSYIVVAKHKTKEYNGLLTIIRKKEIYGLEAFMTVEETNKFRNQMSSFITALCLLEAVNLAFLFGLSRSDVDQWLGILASEISMFALISVMVFFMQNTKIYIYLTQKCFEEIEDALSTYNSDSVLQKLEMMQRLYLSLRSNFSLSSIFFSPSVIVCYIANTVILIICQIYIVLLYVRRGIEFHIYDYQTFIKSMIVILGQIFFCFESEKFSNLLQEPMSFLLKYPVSRLGGGEAAKVENLVRIMIQQDMRMSASEFFVIKAELIVSIVASGLTYLLVALQFHLFW